MLCTVALAVPFTAQAIVCPACGGTRVVPQQMPTTNPVTGAIEFQTVYLPCSTCGGSGVIGESGSDSGSESGTDSGVTSASGNHGAYDYTEGVVDTENGPNLLDGNTETKYNVFSNSCYICWKAPKLISVTGYDITTANDTSLYKGRNPKSWVLYASNKKLPRDSDKWKKIHSVTNDKKLKAKDFTSYSFKLKKKAKAYRYYKLEILDNKGEDCTQLSEFKLKGTVHTSPKTAIKKAVKKGPTKINVKWEKKEVRGYQLQYAKNGKFKKAKKITVTKAGTVSKTVKGLEKGKKYYVRVRTYKVVNKVKVYSKWSKKKSVQL